LLTNFFVGKRHAAKGRYSRDRMYARIQDDPTVWLVEGNLPRADEVTDWLQKDILKLNPDRIQEVRITHADRQKVTIRKVDRNALNYYIVGLPKTAKPRPTYVINAIATDMASIQLQDVRKKPEGDLPVGKPSATVLLTTFDDMRVTIEIWRTGEDILARFDADFDPESNRQSEPLERKGEKNRKSTAFYRGNVGSIGAVAISDFGKTGSGADIHGTIGNIGILTAPESRKHGNTGIQGTDSKYGANTDSVKEEADQLARYWRDWIYILSESHADKLTKRMNDLTE
jgi:hypothetical protein